MRIKPRHIHFLLLTVLFLLSVILPSTREAHVLCLRLVLPLKGKTFVQGQPDGCMIYTIPNVQFSERYRTELVERSGQSADDFALAAATREWSKLKIPSVTALTNHPLADWTILAGFYLEFSYHTNNSGVERSLELVRFGQAANGTNGALWLAEAATEFSARHDGAAIAALRQAAEKSVWTIGGEKNFQYLSMLYENAGLSQLDAAMEANFAASDWYVRLIQSRIRGQLQRLMTQAVNSTNDYEFSNLLGLLVELRKAEWAEGSTRYPNVFRNFGRDDDLCEAIRKRMNLKPEPSSNYEKQRAFKENVFREYLALQSNQAIVSQFWGQEDIIKTEGKLRREILSGPLWREGMVFMMWTIMSGACAALFLYLGFAAVLLQLPFMWLRKVAVRGIWPRKPGFWFCGALLIIGSAAIGAYFLMALGMFSEVGLIADATKGMSALSQSVLVSGTICCSVFILWLTIWKSHKKSIEVWHVVFALGWVYIVAIFAMAYFRFELAQYIMASN